MKKEETYLIFDKVKIAEFRNWLGLNENSLTWQGKFSAEYNEFWELFFIDGFSLEQFMRNFDYVETILQTGTLISWFSWLRERLILFSFLNTGFSLRVLSQKSGFDESRLAFLLRDCFLQKYPYFEEELNSIFSLGNVSSDAIFLTYKKVLKKLDVGDMDNHFGDNLMKSLEVTLYPDWKIVLEKLSKRSLSNPINLQRIKFESSFSYYLKFLRECVCIIVLTLIAIWGVQRANNWYQKYLADKMSLYEPQYLWSDKTLTYKRDDSDLSEDLNTLEVKDFSLADTSDVDPFGKNIQDDEERYETESEVVVTSWDTLPRVFDNSSLEQSEYEEEKILGYRDTRRGRRTVYRVVMRSLFPKKSKENILKLMDKYAIQRADSVEPGIEVPGGRYFNLYVPRTMLKEFLSQIVKMDESVLYESRTRRANPPGKNKVFIWVKSI